MNRKLKILTLVYLILLIACKNANDERGYVNTNDHKTEVSKTSKTLEHNYTDDSITNLISKSSNAKCRIDSSEGVYIPKNLKESHLVLDTMLSDSSKILIANGEESHFGLGMYLRNNWGLWNGGRLKCYFEHQGIKHPDHMSGMIIHTYSMKLNNNKINEDSIYTEALVALEEWNKEMNK